ncbi:MAG: hypothetical protein OER12_10665 [Acidimicrobiia bacterium]|nr:hypothetical protein [Acidimicrobiia bacterium]
MNLPDALTNRVQMLGGLVGRVQALADGLARRSGVMGRLGLVAAPIAWLTLLGRWAFDSIPRFVFFLVVLLLLASPGLVLVAFGRLLGGTVSRSESALEDLRVLAREGGSELGSGVAAVAGTPGLRSLGSLLGSLWKLRDFRTEFGSIVSAVVGSTRLLNPLFLLWVGAAALGAGLLIVLAIVGLVLLVL